MQLTISSPITARSSKAAAGHSTVGLCPPTQFARLRLDPVRIAAGSSLVAVPSCNWILHSRHWSSMIVDESSTIVAVEETHRDFVEDQLRDVLEDQLRDVVEDQLRDVVED